MNEHVDLWNIISFIITPLLVSLIGIFNLYLNSKFNIMEKEIEKTNERVASIEEKAKGLRDNYIDRFAEVNSNLSENKIEILQALHKIDLNVQKISDKVEKQSEFCEMVQKNKRG